MKFSEMKQAIDYIKHYLGQVHVSGEQDIDCMKSCFDILNALSDECKARARAEEASAEAPKKE